jgi:aryl-alcohol dehydrogenase-like predicted oxidoreductase
MDAHANPGRRLVAGRLVLASWLTTAVLSYMALGSFLSELIEGVDPAQLGRTRAGATLVALLASLVATVVWARQRTPRPTPAGAATPAPGGLARRRFLVGAGASLGGLAGAAAAAFARISGWAFVVSPAIQAKVQVTDPAPRDGWKGAHVRSYRRLGRTDFRASDISLGSGRIRPENDGETIARAAIDRGVNYFDTAPDYAATGSETVLGRAVKGRRDRMFLATKFCTATGHLPAGSSVRAYMDVVEGSLTRLQTDYVDLVHIHSCDTLERLLDPNVHEAFDRLREQGKARFLGVSTHTPNLEAVAGAALDSNRFDVLMLAYHHGAWPALGDIVARAAAQDVGIVAMKTLKGARHRGMAEFQEEADSYAQAAFKWVLSNPNVSCLVISFFAHQHLDEYLGASGQALSEQDRAALRRYDELIAGTHCFPHCGACLETCPESLPIHDVLRYRMYFEGYGDEKEAMRLYARLDKQANVCVRCSAPCLNACPHGVPIRERMIGAHRMLTFA